MLIMIAGDYKEGKTISACTFPKPLLFLDWDDGFSSVLNTKKENGSHVAGDVKQIDVVPFFKKRTTPLTFMTQEKSAPAYTSEAPSLIATFNDITNQLGATGKYNGKEYKTLVIDSLTSFFRVWKECILSMNRVGSLRIQDYGTLESVLFGQFFPTLKQLSQEKKVKYIILVDHIAMDKDELSGQIVEYPVGPSINQGRQIGQFLDEIWRQRREGLNYVWRTRKVGLFQAGSRMNLPELIKPASFEELVKYLPKEEIEK